MEDVEELDYDETLVAERTEVCVALLRLRYVCRGFVLAHACLASPLWCCRYSNVVPVACETWHLLAGLWSQNSDSGLRLWLQFQAFKVFLAPAPVPTSNLKVFGSVFGWNDCSSENWKTFVLFTPAWMRCCERMHLMDMGHVQKLWEVLIDTQIRKHVPMIARNSNLTRLSHKPGPWGRNTNFRLRFHRLKVISYNHPKLLWVPDPQPCLMVGLKYVLWKFPPTFQAELLLNVAWFKCPPPTPGRAWRMSRIERVACVSRHAETMKKRRRMRKVVKVARSERFVSFQFFQTRACSSSEQRLLKRKPDAFPGNVFSRSSNTPGS